MAELKQFKCLNDLKKALSELGDYRARPAIRGKDVNLYPERLDGKYRTVMGVVFVIINFQLMKKWYYQIDKWGCHFQRPGATWSLYSGCMQKGQRKNRLMFIGFCLKPICL